MMTRDGRVDADGGGAAVATTVVSRRSDDAAPVTIRQSLLGVTAVRRATAVLGGRLNCKTLRGLFNPEPPRRKCSSNSTSFFAGRMHILLIVVVAEVAGRALLLVPAPEPPAPEPPWRAPAVVLVPGPGRALAGRGAVGRRAQRGALELSDGLAARVARVTRRGGVRAPVAADAPRDGRDLARLWVGDGARRRCRGGRARFARAASPRRPSRGIFPSPAARRSSSTRAGRRGPRRAPRPCCGRARAQGRAPCGRRGPRRAGPLHKYLEPWQSPNRHFMRVHERRRRRRAFLN